MNQFLILLTLNLVVVLLIYSPQLRREWRRKRAERRKWAEVRRQRLRDQKRSQYQKQQLERRRQQAARVKLPQPERECRRYTLKPPAPPSVPSHLLNRLDGLTKSRETSDRLVEGLASQFPGRSRRWLVEKAIADLERDRYR